MSSDTTRTRPLVAVVGPTAAGKTALAEEMSEALGGEIVSADSMQIYRGMDIGTAKPVPDGEVVYHLLDIVDPGEAYSAAQYQRDAREAIGSITGRGSRPILAGGTGLYVRAALDDWEIPSGRSDSLGRRRLEADLAAVGPVAMHDRLASVDPDAAGLLHPNDSRRVLRALEMHEAGHSYADVAARFSTRTTMYDTVFIGISRERSELYSRIDARVDGMLEAGLLHEVETLLDAGFGDALTASQAIGYKELVPVLAGETELADAVARIKQATRRYAKRQLTWFRADPRVTWLDATDQSASGLLDRALGLVSSAGPGTEAV